MVGVDDEAFATVESLLRELGQASTHVGINGRSPLLKLAVNISLAVQTLAFGEGLLLAERGRIDPQLAAEVMSTSSIGSPMLKARVPHPRPTPPGMVRGSPDGEGHPARAYSSQRARNPAPVSCRRRRDAHQGRPSLAVPVATSPPATKSSRPTGETSHGKDRITPRWDSPRTGLPNSSRSRPPSAVRAPCNCSCIDRPMRTTTESGRRRPESAS